MDYRQLNSHTVKDKYPLPRIDDQLDRLGKKIFFMSLDRASKFHQIPIHPDSIHKTEFTVDGHYEYCRIAFGLCNAPAVFQRVFNAALADFKYTIALVYIYDILIPSVTVEQGLTYLEQVLTALEKAEFP